MGLIERVLAVVEGVQREYAPDARTTLFDVGVDQEGRSIVLLGATSDPAAAEELHRRVALLDGTVNMPLIVAIRQEEVARGRHPPPCGPSG